MSIEVKAESVTRKAKRITTAKRFSLFVASRFKLSAFGFSLYALSFLLASCSTKSESTNHNTSTKFQQYYIQGEQLYLKHCSNCHQKNGAGLGLLFPPLNKSDYVATNFEHVICIMEHGISGELIVNGKSFNKEMKGIPSLTDLEIAEIATYIYNSWERKRGIVEVKEVSAQLVRCK